MKWYALLGVSWCNVTLTKAMVVSSSWQSLDENVKLTKAKVSSYNKKSMRTLAITLIEIPKAKPGHHLVKDG